MGKSFGKKTNVKDEESPSEDEDEYLDESMDYYQEGDEDDEDGSEFQIRIDEEEAPRNSMKANTPSAQLNPNARMTRSAARKES